MNNLLFITSPAKLMRDSYEHPLLKATQPEYLQIAEELNAKLKELSATDLMAMMEISAKLADESWSRNQEWKAQPQKKGVQAMYAFTGEVYRGLDAESLTKDAADYLQKHWRILSGLYGLLKPTDSIMPYRLEMGRTFPDGTTLYDVWEENMTSSFTAFKKKKTTVINLASKEYGKVVPWKKIGIRKVDVEFQELKSGKPKTIVVYTKHARGLMLKYAAEQQADSVEMLKNFDYDGYFFDEERSSENRYFFIR